MANDGSGAGGASARGIGFGRQRAFIDQAVDHAGADAGFLRRIGFAVQQAVRQQLDQPPPCRRQALAAARRPAARPAAPAPGRDVRPSARYIRSTMPRADSV